jgi:flagellar motility protein MotE (MotC chaperone)
MNVARLVSLALAIVAGLVLAASPSVGLAQGPAGRKVTGEAYWPSKATRHRVQTARNYAYEFQTYVQNVPKPEPSVVKDIKTELGRYLDEGQKHLATMKKDLEGDKEAVAAVEDLEKQLATAIDHNKAMIACCEGEKFDKIATMSCCTDLVKSLDKVHADHVALMKKLTQKYAQPGAGK